MFTHNLLGLGGTGFGVLLAIGGIGFIGGGLFASRLIRWRGPAAALSIAVVAMAIAELVIPLAEELVTTAAMFALSGAALTIWNIASLSLRQRLAPPGLLGRVSSAYLSVGFGATAVGAALGGATASALGLRAPFLLGAPLLILVLAPLRRSLA